MRDGRTPAIEYIEELAATAAKGRLSKRKAALTLLATINAVLEQLADTGRLEPEREIKALRGDVWEIKPGDARLPFYRRNDHPGVPAIRLTSGFTKDWPHEHPQKLVRFAEKVRGEDGTL